MRKMNLGRKILLTVSILCAVFVGAIVFQVGLNGADKMISVAFVSGIAVFCGCYAITGSKLKAIKVSTLLFFLILLSFAVFFMALSGS